MLTIGSLFSGYGGLDMAAEEVFGARTAWVSDVDKGACKILAHRYPGVPNLGDITTVDWSAVEPVDIITGGSPCQDLSHAGRRAGMSDYQLIQEGSCSGGSSGACGVSSERTLGPVGGPAAATAGAGFTNRWGDYAPAIARHARWLGRTAPDPTETGPKGGQRLSPHLVEWMMCLPDGWVCDTPGLTRNEALKALGNGVIPPQAAHAIRVCLAREAAA